MSTILLALRLREVFLYGLWIANTNYKAQLESINYQQAAKKIAGLNSIAALTFHINYYLDGILKAIDSGKLEISDKYSFDLPAISTENDWKNLVHSLLNNAEKFAEYVEQLQDSKLNEVFFDEKYGNWLRNIEGMIEHSYYHLGQIVLIRKLTLT